MALFGKKEPCPICGGKIGLLASKVEGKKVCSDCYGLVDLPEGAINHMTIHAFRGYMGFREENQRLKEQFTVTKQVDFGFFDTKFLFDTTHRLLCFDKSLNKTIFEGTQIRSFVIREDSMPLFEGGPDGLVRHNSQVPDRLAALAPQISQMAAQARMQREMERMIDRLDDDDKHRTHHYTTPDIPEPFRAFYVEIRFNHPYWSVFTADRNGPTFNNSYPDANSYLRDYQASAAIMEELAQALMAVAFPGAPERVAGSPVGASPTAAASPVGSTNVVEELQRFKSLMDQGILTEEEFTAKKRQLLGL